ncbi:DUF2264 domain-containing protein [Croceivirga radicis]|uniref:DUF2264 domain-containing protein n=1 Tax=Croceivirga radicis TaxID=1929488 RepID=UPI000255B017|nr:DUF2264 domain-containing protein [Croceivirga radicis]
MDKTFYYPLLLLCLFLTVTNNGISQEIPKNEMPLFSVKNPDTSLSPLTGMTKKHWEEAALYLLEGAFSYINNLDDPMQFPKLPGKSYPQKDSQIPTEKLEGISRTLFIASPLLRKNPDLVINSIPVAKYYRYQLEQLIDTNSTAYIKPRKQDGGPSQNLVEYGAMAMSLFIAPEVLWEPLPQVSKDKLAASMLSYADGPTVDSNWKFFNIFVLSFFDTQGYDVNKKLLVTYLEDSLLDYRGQGWYNDSPAYDYYSMWAFQLYGITWANWYGEEHYPELAQKFKTNYQDMLYHYPTMFAENGQMMMWGRSISYRFASVSPFAFASSLRDDTVNYGWLRYISSSTLLQFLEHPAFLKNRVPTLGFYDHFEPVVQIYSARGSVYWMGKLFFGLLVPDDDPFWTATENKQPWNNLNDNAVYNKFQEATNLLITQYPAIGGTEMRSWCHEKKANDWQKFRSSENYNKLAYHSLFPWQADGEDGIISMNYTFLNSNKEWEPWRLYTFKSYHEGIYQRTAQLETNAEVKMELSEIPLPNGVLRIDKQLSTVPVKMRFGHYALPELNNPIKKTTQIIDGHKVITIDNGKYQLALVNLLGWDKIEVNRAKDLHAEADFSEVINAMDNYNPQEENAIYASLLLWKNSGEKWSPDELYPIESLKVLENRVTVVLKGGKVKTINY